MENTQISWSDNTFNPWIGCSKVSPACDHCYAERDNVVRFHRLESWDAHSDRQRTSASNWKLPPRWHRKALANATRTRTRVFCASYADVFDNHKSILPSWRSDLWDLIRATPALDWMLLTKRPENIRKMLPSDWGNGWRHVWLGTTCENEECYLKRFPVLLSIPAAIHFISYEPALGPLRLDPSLKPDWVIFGGESGKHWRPIDLAWARTVRDDCQRRGVAFFMKQIAAVNPQESDIPADLMIRDWPPSPAARLYDQNEVQLISNGGRMEISLTGISN
jgi:protein gp37